MSKSILNRHLRIGSLHIHLPKGRILSYGQGQPEAHMQFKSRTAFYHALSNPQMNIGEAYMRGEWQPAQGDLLQVFEVLFRNWALIPEDDVLSKLSRVRHWLLRETNNARRAQKNIHQHYDVSEAVYRRFLDADMQYSCAYFMHPDMTLEEAQQAKKEHIGRKLCLQPGETVLDIGCGWGGMALYLAREYDARVTGLTLSTEQLRVARQRAEEEGLTHRVNFELQDYRQHQERYDAIVSVGMFEHVGRPQYELFYKDCHRLLKAGGRMLLHHIGHTGAPGVPNPWIDKYIFPGGYIPCASEVLPHIERSGLVTADMEVLHSHYAETLRHWRQRFARQRKATAAEMGEEFCRMWEFYLASCEAAFRWLDLVVFQFQFSRDAHTLPMTRDYLYNAQPALTQLQPPRSQVEVAQASDKRLH